MSDNELLDSVKPPATRRRFLAAAAGVGAASLATGTAAASDEHDRDDYDETGDDEERQPFAAIEFSNQRSDGAEIVVDSTTLSEGGYVAIHDLTLFQGEVTGSVIGVSEYLGPGVHYSVPVSLFDVPGATFESDSLDRTTPLVAMPHQETSGNETYEFVESGGEMDGPYAESGLPVIDAGFVTVDGQESATEDAPFATLEFQNEAGVEETVTVRDVTLSDGGFITFHDARLLQGKPFESVVGVSEYLEPGRHQSVEVTIEDPCAITEVQLPARPLLPMPHQDTDGNQEYGFVETEGAEDGPYTKAGQAVIDAGLVTVGD